MEPMDDFNDLQYEDLNNLVGNDLSNVNVNQHRMQNRKRQSAELYGMPAFPEIDCDFITKKQKNELILDLEQIDAIIIKRQLQTKRVNTLVSNEADKFRVKCLKKFKLENLSSHVPKWPCIPIAKSKAFRIYVRLHSEQYEKSAINEILLKGIFSECLIGQNKSEIWKNANEIIMKKSHRTFAPADGLLNSEEHFIPDVSNEVNLWVEKYKPKQYIDLLSDESTNKSLLSWLKTWDKIVFNRELCKTVKKTSSQKFNTFNKKTGRFDMMSKSKNKSNNNSHPNFDENGPLKRIVLISGPPGIGKTTLVHTIVKQAGYAARELNASDDRNPDAFRLVLENGTQMTSVLDIKHRPNCIVMDEIDGAPQASIDVLLRFVQGSAASNNGKNKDNHTKGPTKRPIICICNDLYVPALRKLRQYAFVIKFPEIESTRLAERLFTIAKSESIKTDMTTLLMLAAKTGNDIRSCISILQFYNSIKKPLTPSEIMKSGTGQKDRHKGLFEIWTAIFRLQQPQKLNEYEQFHVDTNFPSGQASSTSVIIEKRWQNILDMVHCAGEYERLILGIYENIFAQINSYQIQSIHDATDWFCFTDKIQRFTNQTQNYISYRYLQYGFVAWHFIFAKPNVRAVINFPSKGYEATQKFISLKMILTSLMKGINPKCKGIGEGITFLLDTASYLKRTICPILRPVSFQLLSAEEKTNLNHSVRIMTDLNIKYIQLRAADGTYYYKVEPDIDYISNFAGCIEELTNYFVKQLIAQEVEQETIRRSSLSYSEISNRKQENTKTPKQVPAINLPNHLRTLTPNTVNQNRRKESTSTDFFGRIVVNSDANGFQKSMSSYGTLVKSSTCYHYKEGFNNALRKDVLITDLI